MKREDLTAGMHVAVVGPFGDQCTYEERVVESTADPEDGLGYVTTSAVNHLGHPLGGTMQHTGLDHIVSKWADRPVYKIEVPYVIKIRVDHEPRGWLKITEHSAAVNSFPEALGHATKTLAGIARTEALEARDPLYRARVHVVIAESAAETDFPFLVRTDGRTYSSGWVDVHIEIERLRRLTTGD